METLKGKPQRLTHALQRALGAGTATRLVKRAKATHAKIALGASTGMSQQQEVWVQGALQRAPRGSMGPPREKRIRPTHALISVLKGDTVVGQDRLV